MKCGAMVASVLFALMSSAAAPWSDTPVTCHYIGAVKGGTSTGGDFAEWTNPDNWAEGVVPGMYIENGVTNGCPGCTAVFDRECDYPTVDFSYNYIVAISNIIVTGSTVPKITFGRRWDWRNPYLYLEGGGGIYVSADVVTAPEVHSGIKYLRGSSGPATTFYFENNSSTPLTLGGFNGPDVNFSSYAGVMYFEMRGTGEIRQARYYVRSLYALYVRLNMNGGKYVQDWDATIETIITGSSGIQQRFEIPAGVVVNVVGTGPSVSADSSDLLISGEGTCNFSSAASSVPSIAVSSGRTLTLDCNITRTAGGKIQLGGWWGDGGTVALASGRSFNAPIDFFNGATLKLADGLTFSDAVAIPDYRYGTICGGSETEAKITGGVAGTTRPLTLKGRLAIASDITATTTLAADGELSFRKAADAATSFTIFSLKLMDDETIPVEDGVTATIATIDNNGHTLDIRPSGSGKVLFTGLSAGRAPEWLTLNGARGKIAADGELLPSGGMLLIYR